MTTPFDAIAPHYDLLWGATEKGRRQRSQVWREFDGLFGRGDLVLDLGCGTGDDALHLASAGVRVFGIDASPEMVRIAQSRGVVARLLRIEEIATLEGPLDGAISNFGAFNCIRDLGRVAGELARLVRPGRAVALCFLTRFCLLETVSFLLNLSFRKAVRRWPGQTTWRGTQVFYPTSRDIRRTFRPWFRLTKRVRIGGGDHALYIFERGRSC